MYANVTLQLEVHPDAIQVRDSAVATGPDGSYVIRRARRCARSSSRYYRNSQRDIGRDCQRPQRRQKKWSPPSIRASLTVRWSRRSSNVLTRITRQSLKIISRRARKLCLRFLLAPRPLRCSSELRSARDRHSHKHRSSRANNSLCKELSSWPCTTIRADSRRALKPQPWARQSERRDRSCFRKCMDPRNTWARPTTESITPAI